MSLVELEVEGSRPPEEKKVVGQKRLTASNRKIRPANKINCCEDKPFIQEHMSPIRVSQRKSFIILKKLLFPA